MKSTDFVLINEDCIQFVQSGKSYPLSNISSVTLKSFKVDKKLHETLLNSFATFATSSLANGDERVKIAIEVKFKDEDAEIISMHNDCLVRNSLEYHDIVKSTRNLVNKIKKKKPE